MFVALWPPGRTKEQLLAMGLDQRGGLRWVRPEQWHVTLRFLGDVDPEDGPLLVDALAAEVATLAGPVRCRVGPETAWLGAGRVLCLPVLGAEGAAAAVRAATLRLAPASADGEQPFTGHLTLGRVSGRPLREEARAALAGVPFDAAFDARHLDLVGSQRTGNGHRYTVLGSVPLG